jgi:carbamoylphosphate synthase large subunit
MRVRVIGPGDAVAKAAAEVERLGHEVADEDADAIVGVGSDEAFREAARVAEERGIAHPWSAEAAVRGTDIAAARRALAGSDLLQPHYRECTTAEEARLSVWELGLPVIVRTLGDAVRATASKSREIPELAERAIRESYRPACVVEEKLGGGCSRGSNAEIDELIGLPCQTKTVTSGHVIGIRALAADASPEDAVRSVLGVNQPV